CCCLRLLAFHLFPHSDSKPARVHCNRKTSAQVEPSKQSCKKRPSAGNQYWQSFAALTPNKCTTIGKEFRRIGANYRASERSRGTRRPRRFVRHQSGCNETGKPCES